ncbi:MAG: hypothetical protein AB1763_07275 [Campylobacterota bacterium]
MRRVAYWLFPLIAAAVAAFIVIFMIQINPSVPLSERFSGGGEETSSSAASAEEESWLERFSRSEEKDYHYPVNEVHMVLDAGEHPEVPAYRMTVPLKDSYELFCVKQELYNKALPYFLQKEGDAMTLLVDSNDEKTLASLVTKLKTYQITATLSPYTEEK